MNNFLIKELGEISDKKREKQSLFKFSLDLDDLLYRVQKPSIKINNERISIKLEEFIQLCRTAKNIFLEQPNLLRIQGPIYIATGTLGSFKDLSNVIDKCGPPKFMNYLFLGDYAGRYNRSTECLVALLTYKIMMPNNFFMLRGCYENIKMAMNYNLYTELAQYFHTSKAWLQICEVFASLPYAAVVDDKIFCVHGGISPYLQSLDQINTIRRPMNTPTKEFGCDLIWSDPTNLYEGWTENDRGVSISFGADIVTNFLKNHDISLICRGHEIPYNGFQFFGDKKVVTICSLAKYCEIYNNTSAVMMVDDKSNVLFKSIYYRNEYINKEYEEQMTFFEIVQRKKEIKSKQMQNQEPKIDEDLRKIEKNKRKEK